MTGRHAKNLLKNTKFDYYNFSYSALKNDIHKHKAKNKTSNVECLRYEIRGGFWKITRKNENGLQEVENSCQRGMQSIWYVKSMNLKRENISIA